MLDLHGSTELDSFDFNDFGLLKGYMKQYRGSIFKVFVLKTIFSRFFCSCSNILVKCLTARLNAEILQTK